MFVRPAYRIMVTVSKRLHALGPHCRMELTKASRNSYQDVCQVKAFLTPDVSLSCSIKTYCRCIVYLYGATGELKAVHGPECRFRAPDVHVLDEAEALVSAGGIVV